MGVMVSRLTMSDQGIARFIVDNLVDNASSRPKSINMDRILGDKSTYLLAATTGEIVIGYALAYRFPSLYSENYLAYLYDIEVLETHRRKGAGRMLIETMLGLLKKDGVDELWLGTGVDNVEGQALYKSTGAVKSPETFNDYTYEL